MYQRLLWAGMFILATTSSFAALDKEPTAKSPEPSPKATDREKKRPKALPANYHACTLNITWWDEPPLAEGQRLELAYLVDATTTPFIAGAMQMGQNIEYTGPTTLTIVRKVKNDVATVDRKGQPTTKSEETWVPFATSVLPEGSQDTLVLLMMIPGKPLAVGRAFDINHDTFPFGSFHILNFTKARVGCNLGGKVFFAEPGKRSPSPLVMTQRQVVNFRLAIFEASGEQRRLYSTPIILDERTRRLYFVTEYPGNEIDQRYDTRTLVDYRIEQPSLGNDPTPETAEPKGKPAAKTAKKAATKTEN